MGRKSDKGTTGRGDKETRRRRDDYSEEGKMRRGASSKAGPD